MATDSTLSGYAEDADGNSLGVYVGGSVRAIVPLNPDFTEDWTGRAHERAEYVFRWDEREQHRHWVELD